MQGLPRQNSLRGILNNNKEIATESNFDATDTAVDGSALLSSCSSVKGSSSMPKTLELMEDSRVQSRIHHNAGNLFFPAILRRDQHLIDVNPEQVVVDYDDDDDDEGDCSSSLYHQITAEDTREEPCTKTPLHHDHLNEQQQEPILRSDVHNNIARQPALRALEKTKHHHHSNNNKLMEKSIWKPRGLTLSAFRRPENAIRLTDADPLRRLEMEYDLHCRGKSGVLGHGAFSTVRLAVRLKDGIQVAVKSIAKHEALRSRRLRRVHGKAGHKYYLEEWEILKRLHGHAYICNLLDVFETDEEIQLVTEYCPHGELFDAIQKKQMTPMGASTSSFRDRTGSKVSERKAAAITYQVLRALADVHAAGIVHRDVKPENILLAKPYDGETIHVKLCDFGVARPLVFPEEAVAVTEQDKEKVCVCDGEVSPLPPASRSQSFSAIGSDYYAAPELSFGGSYGAAVDVYSLGVTLYILLCGFPPIFGHYNFVITQESDDDDSFNNDSYHQEVLFPDIYWNEVSEDVKDLLRKMLHPDATTRITAKTALCDSWFAHLHHHGHWSQTTPLFQQRNTPPPVDLQMVRDELYKSLKTKALRRSSSRDGRFPSIVKQRPASAPTRKRSMGDSYASSSSNTTTPVRRRRIERRSSTPALMALADLCRGVPTPSVFAAAAAAAAQDVVTEAAANTSAAGQTNDMRPAALATLSF
jgi:serine/threonine protein kinase